MCTEPKLTSNLHSRADTLSLSPTAVAGLHVRNPRHRHPRLFCSENLFVNRGVREPRFQCTCGYNKNGHTEGRVLLLVVNEISYCVLLDFKSKKCPGKDCILCHIKHLPSCNKEMLWKLDLLPSGCSFWRTQQSENLLTWWTDNPISKTLCLRRTRQWMGM